CRPGRLGAAVEVVVELGEVPARVGGDDHAIVADVEQAVVGLDRHGLTGQVAAHGIAVVEDRDAALVVDAAGGGTGRLGRGGRLDVAVDDLDGRRLGE